MEQIPVYGKEHTFLEERTGLLFRNSSLKETASIHTHTFYEFFINFKNLPIMTRNRIKKTCPPFEK